jgi:hypothetical protein
MARAVRQLASTGRMSSLAIPVLEDAADHIDKLTAQRDELLKALKAMDVAFNLAMFRGDIGAGTEHSTIANNARAAIEKAEATSHV